MPDQTSHAARPLFAIAAMLGVMALAACADGGTTPTPGSFAAKAQSPLAAPPSAMMTPHGY